MDKIASKEETREDIQSQDPEIYQDEKVYSNYLQLNRQLQENKEPTQDVLKQIFLQATKESKQCFSKEAEMKKEIDVNIKRVEKSAGNSLVPAQDLRQTIRQEAIKEKCDELVDNEILESERRITMQQITENPEDMPTIPAQNTIPTAEYHLNDAALQDLNNIEKNGKLEKNAELQQSDLPRKLTLLDKKDLQQLCEELEKKVKVRNELGLITQAVSATPYKLSETLADGKATLSDEQPQEKMQQKEKLRRILAEFLEKNKVHQEETKICKQKNRHSFEYTSQYNSKEIEHKSKETEIYGKPEGNWNNSPRELRETYTKYRSKSEDGVLLRSREQESDVTRGHQETKQGIIKPESQNPKQSKDYVTSHKRLSNEFTTGPQKMKDYVTSRRPDLSKTKGYVTCRPQRPEIETAHSDTSKRISLKSQMKGYVTSRPIKQNTIEPDPQPPNDDFMSDELYEGIALDPGPSTQIHMPEPPRFPLTTQQLEKGKKASRRTHPHQTQLSQNQTSSPVTENDVPFDERCPENTIETEEPGVERNRRLLGIKIPSLTGTWDFKRMSCVLFFCGLFIIGLVIFAPSMSNLLESKAFEKDSTKITSTQYEYRHILNIPMSDQQQHSRQTKPLDRKVNILSVAHMIDTSDNFTTTVDGFDVNTANSSVDLDPEIISKMKIFNDDVNNPEITSESTVTTLMTNVVVRLINFEFGVTSNVNDFDINAITPMTDLGINVIHPLPELDIDD